MKIGVLGTGTVGKTIGSKLAALGHQVRMGSRSAGNESAAAWAKASGGSQGTFADAAAFGELLFNCTSGAGSIDALRACGDALSGKVLVDISNPLDFSRGFPPTLFVSNDDSLGERIQREFPGLRVVKSLNTLTAELMVDPRRLAGGDHDVFVAGNDAAAKAQVVELLRSFGWKAPIDLGDIAQSRGLEAWLPLWVRLYGTFKSAEFNLKIVRA